MTIPSASDGSSQTSVGFSESMLVDIACTRANELKAFIGRFERDPAKVAELCQDVLLEAHRCSASYRKDASAESWIFGIARNLGRKHQQREARRLRTDSLDDDDDEASPALKVEDELADPMVLLVMRRQLDAISRKVSGWPESLRATFQHLVLDEMTYQDAAEAMNVPIGTVRSRLSRARALLEHVK